MLNITSLKISSLSWQDAEYHFLITEECNRSIAAIQVVCIKLTSCHGKLSHLLLLHFSIWITRALSTLIIPDRIRSQKHHSLTSQSSPLYGFKTLSEHQPSLHLSPCHLWELSWPTISRDQKYRVCQPGQVYIGWPIRGAVFSFSMIRCKTMTSIHQIHKSENFLNVLEIL